MARMQNVQEDDIRVGCKVTWRYYHDEGMAREQVKVARHNAAIDEAAGYDFGYQNPGDIEQVKAGKRAGMWEVCCP